MGGHISKRSLELTSNIILIKAIKLINTFLGNSEMG